MPNKKQAHHNSDESTKRKQKNVKDHSEELREAHNEIRELTHENTNLRTELLLLKNKEIVETREIQELRQQLRTVALTSNESDRRYRAMLENFKLRSIGAELGLLKVKRDSDTNWLQRRLQEVVTNVGHVQMIVDSLSARATTAEVMEGVLKYRQEWMNIVSFIRTVIDKVQSDYELMMTAIGSGDATLNMLSPVVIPVVPPPPNFPDALLEHLQQEQEKVAATEPNVDHIKRLFPQRESPPGLDQMWTARHHDLQVTEQCLQEQILSSQSPVETDDRPDSRAVSDISSNTRNQLEWHTMPSNGHRHNMWVQSTVDAFEQLLPEQSTHFPQYQLESNRSHSSAASAASTNSRNLQESESVTDVGISSSAEAQPSQRSIERLHLLLDGVNAQLPGTTQTMLTNASAELRKTKWVGRKPKTLPEFVNDLVKYLKKENEEAAGGAWQNRPKTPPPRDVQAKLAEGNHDCKICLSQCLITEDLLCCPTSSCNEPYHRQCVNKWLIDYSSRDCPNCRKPWLSSTEFPSLMSVR